MNPMSNIQVYGLENAVKVSKYPMAVDIDDGGFEVENLKYWTQFGDFIFDFIKYQNKYGKNKGNNNKDSCLFCGSDLHVEKKNAFDGNYYCSKCGHQIDRYGAPFETTPKYTLLDDYIEMTVYGDNKNEKIVKISYESLPLIFYKNWSTNGDKYIKNEDGVFMHTFLFKDILKDDEIVDHKNRDIFDNTLDNLRVCTKQENTMNCGVSKNNRSGITGVSWKKDRNKWKSYITYNHKQIHLGYYDDFDDAVKARLIGEKTIFQDFAPQQHLFQKYGIDYDLEDCNNTFKFNLKEAMKSFKRAKNLGHTRSGEGHDNWLNGIVVQFDLTFTNKAWVEAERYHFLDFISSQSTMHRITKFDIDKQYIKYVDYRVIDIMKEKVDEYNRLVALKPESDFAEYNEMLAEKYLGILYTNPAGFLITAGMTTNYRQLKTIYQQRKNHRLPEWRSFCKQLEELPHFMELCFGAEGEE